MSGGARGPYRFGDLLALSRRSWVLQMQEAVASAGYDDYRQADSAFLRRLQRQPLAIGEIGVILGVTRQAARQLADGLVSRGYAVFESDPADGRRKLVRLTPAGGAYATVVLDAQRRLNERLEHRITPADLAAADRVLRAVFATPEAQRRIDRWIPPPDGGPPGSVNPSGG